MRDARCVPAVVFGSAARRLFSVVLLVLVACGGGSGAPATDPPVVPPVTPPPSGPAFPLFEDVTDAAGIAAPSPWPFGYETSGQAWGDYDGDGWLDLYVTRQDGPNVLYRNRGDGTFEVSPVSSEVALPTGMSGGAVFVDYDDDGWEDLYVVQWGANVLFRNEQGQGFSDVTQAAGVGDDGRGMTASFGDYDRDGHLDLYVTNWGYAHATTLEDPYASRDRLYHNEGNGTFTDVTSLLGDAETTGLGFVASFVDLDGDGDVDIYLVNDKGYSGPPPTSAPFNRNVLWRNDGIGPSGWTFTEVAVAAGADARMEGMGLAIGDFDHDGDPDLFASNEGPAVLLVNHGDGTFQSRAADFGLDVSGSSWGTVFGDFDLDGHPDLYLALDAQGNRLWLGDGGTTFTDVSAASGASDPGRAAGVAMADYDRDGWPDLVIAVPDGAYHLLHNRGASNGNVRRSLTVRLRGGDGVNRDAVGSVVTVTRADGLVMTDRVVLGASLGSGSDLALTFGLAASTPAEVRIRWPDGREDVHTSDVPASGEWIVSR